MEKKVMMKMEVSHVEEFLALNRIFLWMCSLLGRGSPYETVLVRFLKIASLDFSTFANVIRQE